MPAHHDVITHAPFWGPVAAMTAAVLLMVPACVFGPAALGDAGILPRDIVPFVMIGCIVLGTLALIQGLVWSSARAGKGHGPQLPGTKTAKLRITAAGIEGPKPVFWDQLAEVVHIPGAVTVSAAAAIPQSIGGVPIRRNVGAVILVLQDNTEVVLSPLSADAGAALAQDLAARLERHTAGG